MRKIMLFAVILLFSCSKTPPAAAPRDEVKTPIATMYVGVPAMNLYAQPNDTAPVISSYGYTESVSVLSRKDNWAEVRSFDGESAWAHWADLVTAADVDPYLKNPTPRFAKPPQAIPNNRAHGTIAFEAKVNTDGDVVDVKLMQNTTGRADLADANADALRQAKFFPLIQKGQHAAFTYEHRVVY